MNTAEDDDNRTLKAVGFGLGCAFLLMHILVFFYCRYIHDYTGVYVFLSMDACFFILFGGVWLGFKIFK